MKVITASIGAALLLGVATSSAIAQENSPKKERMMQQSVIKKPRSRISTTRTAR